MLKRLEKLKKYNHPKKIIKLGYSRHDDLIKNKIIQILMSQNFNKNNFDCPFLGIKVYLESGLGKNLVNELLSLGYVVILRPHPQTIKFAKQK